MQSYATLVDHSDTQECIMNLQLAGKTALVSGSDRGTGQCIARVLAAEGATVVLHSNTEAALPTGGLAVWGTNDIVNWSERRRASCRSGTVRSAESGAGAARASVRNGELSFRGEF